GGVVAPPGPPPVPFHPAAPDTHPPAKLPLPPAPALPAGKPAPAGRRPPVPAPAPRQNPRPRTGTRAHPAGRNRAGPAVAPATRHWAPAAQPRGYPASIWWSWQSATDASARMKAVERGTAAVAPVGRTPVSRGRLEHLSVRYPDRLPVTPPLGTTFFFLNTRV